MTYNDLLREVRCSVPSKEVLKVARNLAIINPYDGKLLILKQRDRDKELTYSDFSPFSVSKISDYALLHDKNVMIDFSSINNRGKEALKLLSEIPN